MNDETTLLPCPFCGASGYIAEHNHGYYPTAKHDRDCPMAQMGFPESEFYIKPEFAVKSWNTRAELGSGTCRDVSANPLRFECSECGGLSIEIAPRFCPCCGREVVFEC